MAVILTDKTGNECAMVISFCREKRQGSRMWERELAIQAHVNGCCKVLEKNEMVLSEVQM
jgi:hypothetical protein